MNNVPTRPATNLSFEEGPGDSRGPGSVEVLEGRPVSRVEQSPSTSTSPPARGSRWCKPADKASAFAVREAERGRVAARSGVVRVKDECEVVSGVGR